MKDEDKRLIVESVGLCWHKWEMSYNNQIPRLRLYRCLNEKCKYHNTDNGVLVQPQLDPLDPADMYGKVWVAFRRRMVFVSWLKAKKARERFQSEETTIHCLARTLTSAPNLAAAMLEYFKEKEK